MKMYLRNPKIFAICIIFLSIQVKAQKLVPEWVESIYSSKSANIDSFRKTILAKKEIDISLKNFSDFLKPILEKDSTEIDRIKTLFILKKIIEDIDSCSGMDYETLFFYNYFMDETYCILTKSQFALYKEEYNSILNYGSKHCIYLSKKIYEDNRTIALYKKYMQIRPYLIQEENLYFFRSNNISAYNDLILEYILKSPDSILVNWNNEKQMPALPEEAMYTLFYFGDRRVLPYYIYSVKNLGWGRTRFLREVLYTYEMQKTNDILYIQLMVFKALYEKEGALSMQDDCEFTGLSIEYKDYPVKPLLYYLGLLFPEELPFEKRTILEQKPPEEMKRVALDIIDKKLKELEQENK